MHQQTQLLADAVLRERDLQRQRPDHHHRHPLGTDRPVRRHLARALVRLARVVEPGVAGPAVDAVVAPTPVARPV